MKPIEIAVIVWCVAGIIAEYRIIRWYKQRKVLKQDGKKIVEWIAKLAK